MGQQQLLLIALGVIIVGVAVMISINLFRAGAIDNKTDLLINESSSLATLAMSYYKKDTMLGGGGKSFTGWTIPSQMVTTASGTFRAEVYSDSVVIIGTGNEVVTGTDSVKIKTTVLSDHFSTEKIN